MTSVHCTTDWPKTERAVSNVFMYIHTPHADSDGSSIGSTVYFQSDGTPLLELRVQVII